MALSLKTEAANGSLGFLSSYWHINYWYPNALVDMMFPYNAVSGKCTVAHGSTKIRARLHATDS